MKARAFPLVILAIVLCVPLAYTQENSTNPAEAFHSVNEARERPRIALLWNRSFTDDLMTEYTRFEKTQRQTNSSSTAQTDATNTQFGSASLSTDDDETRSQEETTSGYRKQPGAQREHPGEKQDWQLETSFTQALLKAGARLIDRAVVMRTVNEGRSEGERPDAQATEARAFLGKADLLLEVLLSRDESAPAGVMFKVMAKDIKTGELLMQFSTYANPQLNSRGHYRAAAYGFEYVPPEATLSDVGQQLGYECLGALAYAWRTR